jgi:L-asparaginase/Glu-tRNA(Gln) amidotransferase subunit D
MKRYTAAQRLARNHSAKGVMNVYRAVKKAQSDSKSTK